MKNDFVDSSHIQIDKPSLIYVRDRKLLMVRSRGQELFYIPGGKREGFETISECLVREIREELGVEVIPETMQELFNFEAQAHGKPDGTMVRFTCIAAELQGDPVSSNEVEEIRFLNSKDELLTPEAGVLILKEMAHRGLID